MKLAKLPKTGPIITSLVLAVTLALIAMFSAPLDNTFVTLGFFVIFGFLSYNLIKLAWWLVARRDSRFGSRLFVVLAVELTVGVMLNSASKIGFSDIIVMLLLGAGVLVYMRWRFARY